MRTEGSLYQHTSNGITTIEFGHPASNSFPSTLLNRLCAALDQCSEDPETKLVVLKSEGEKAFCAGASFDELLAVSDETSGKEFFSGFARVLLAMRRCKKPIIGRVQGKTVGGGVGIISACDYVLAAEAASIKLSEISIGIGPFVIAPAIERKAGVAALAELSLAPTEWKTAYWAQEKGLFAKVLPSIADLDKEVDLLSSKLASYNPEALTAMKTALWESTPAWEELLMKRAAVSGKLVLSEFTKNALAKFRRS